MSFRVEKSDIIYLIDTNNIDIIKKDYDIKTLKYYKITIVHEVSNRYFYNHNFKISIYEYCCLTKKKEISQWLRENNCIPIKFNALFFIVYGDIEIIEELIDKNFYENFKISTHIFSPNVINVAICYNNFEMIKWLYNNCKINSYKLEQLVNACAFGNLDIIKWIYKNMDIDEGECNHNPLSESIDKDNYNIVDWLYYNTNYNCSSYRLKEYVKIKNNSDIEKKIMIIKFITERTLEEFSIFGYKSKTRFVCGRIDEILKNSRNDEITKHLILNYFLRFKMLSYDELKDEDNDYINITLITRKELEIIISNRIFKNYYYVLINDKMLKDDELNIKYKYKNAINIIDRFIFNYYIKNILINDLF